MYQVTIKGRTIEELKKAVIDINQELQGGVISSPNAKVEKDMDKVETQAPVESVKTESSTPDVPHTSAPTPSAPAPQSNGDDLDSQGMPWDARIHAKTKTQTKEGKWKRRKGVEDEVFYEVTKELKNKAPQSPVAETPQAPAAPVTPTPQAPATPEAPSAPVTPQAPAQPAAAPAALPTQAPVPQATNGGHTLETFKAQFPLIFANLISEGKIDQDYVNQLKNHFGVSEIWNVNDEQKQLIFDHFAEHKLIQKVG